MRTQDRTYLAQLGFGDTDKKNELHDYCCMYLTQPEKIKKLYDEFYTVFEAQEPEITITKKGEGYTEKEIKTTKQVTDITYTDVKCTLSKPLNGYKTSIVGYTDVYLEQTESITTKSLKETKFTQPDIDTTNMSYFEMTKNARYMQQDENWDYITNETTARHILIEVKAGRTSIPNIIQQFSTYENFLCHNQPAGIMKWKIRLILCTLYHLNEQEISQLETHHIYHIYVNPESVKEYMTKPSNIPQDSF